MEVPEARFTPIAASSTDVVLTLAPTSDQPVLCIISHVTLSVVLSAGRVTVTGYRQEKYVAVSLHSCKSNQGLVGGDVIENTIQRVTFPLFTVA